MESLRGMARLMNRIADGLEENEEIKVKYESEKKEEIIEENEYLMNNDKAIDFDHPA